MATFNINTTNQLQVPSSPKKPDEGQNQVADGFADVQVRLSQIKDKAVAQNDYKFADLIGNDDITLLQSQKQDSNPPVDPKISRLFDPATSDKESELAQSLPNVNSSNGEKSSSSYSILDGSQNSTPVSPAVMQEPAHVSEADIAAEQFMQVQ